MVRRKSGRPKSNASKASPSKGNFEMDKRAKKYRVNLMLKEIRQLQKSTTMLIPRAPFARLVRQIMLDLFPRLDLLRVQHMALEALQEAAEMYLVQFFEDALLICLHTKRVTLMVQDMILCRRLRGRGDIINR